MDGTGVLVGRIGQMQMADSKNSFAIKVPAAEKTFTSCTCSNAARSHEGPVRCLEFMLSISALFLA